MTLTTNGQSPRLFILVSLLLHLTALYLTSGGGEFPNGNTSNGTKKFNGASVVGEITEKNLPTEISVVIPEETDPTMPKKEQPIDADKECPNRWYGGVGIHTRFNELGDEIFLIHKGYPASLNGLQIGDIILNVDGGEIIGTPGTTVRMTILRQGRHIQYMIVRGKICYN